MTYCASYPRYACERRPLSRDALSIAGLGCFSVGFIALAGACLIYAQPGGTLRLAKTPAVAPIAIAAKVAPKPQTAAAPRIAAPQPRMELSELTLSLDFAP